MHAAASKHTSWLWDVFESSTTYHREPRDVKIKVGWIRLLGIFLTFALIGFMVYTISTTNMHLEEVVPVGQFSHWAGGSGGVSAKANEQWLNSSLCHYDPKYDYLYGLDNEWGYNAAVCERTSLGENAFKSAASMHFVTYESQRVDVLLLRNGSSCDEECQSVYPEWPAADTYGTNDYRSVHVETPLDAAMRRQNSSLSKAANVHMMKPQSSGADRCQCYSYQNIFKLGMDAAGLYLTHSYSTPHVRGSSKLKGDSDPISILIADGAVEPFAVLDKGEPVAFKLEQVMNALGTCLDCQPEAAFWQNSLCPDEGEPCPAPYQPKPTPRVSGMMIDVRTEYYSHKLTMPLGGMYDFIKENHEPPYAVHIFSSYEDWASRGSDSTIVEDSPERKVTIDRYRYGVLFRIKPAAGVISRLNMGVIVNNLCNFTVMMGYPGMFMSVVVFALMGQRSKLFRKGQRQVLTVLDMYRNYTYAAIVAQKAFEVLDTNKSGFIEHKELKSHVTKLMGPCMRARFPDKPESWLRKKISDFSDEIIDGFQPGTPKAAKALAKGGSKQRRGISYEEFVHHATFSCSLDWDDIANKIIEDEGGFCRRRKKTNVVACESEEFAGASTIVPQEELSLKIVAMGGEMPPSELSLEHASELLCKLQDSAKKSFEEHAREMQTLKDEHEKETAKLREEVKSYKAEMSEVSQTLNSIGKSSKKGSAETKAGEPEAPEIS